MRRLHSHRNRLLQTPKPDNTAKPENARRNQTLRQKSKPETPQKPEDNNEQTLQESEESSTICG